MAQGCYITQWLHTMKQWIIGWRCSVGGVSQGLGSKVFRHRVLCNWGIKRTPRAWRGVLVQWGLGAAMALASLIWSYPAEAIPWQPVTPAGLEQQFIDPASIQTGPEGTVQVRSLYLDQRQSPAQHTTYITEYRCQTREFRDVEYDGQPGNLTWQSVATDPLNAQTLDYVCAQVAQSAAVVDPAPTN